MTIEHVNNMYRGQRPIAFWHTHPHWASYESLADLRNLEPPFSMEFFVTCYIQDKQIINLVNHKINGVIVRYFTDVPGDVNGDGKLTMSDAYVIARHLAHLKKLTPEELARADIDGDGKAGIKDAMFIAQKVLRLL